MDAFIAEHVFTEGGYILTKKYFSICAVDLMQIMIIFEFEIENTAKNRKIRFLLVFLVQFSNNLKKKKMEEKKKQ